MRRAIKPANEVVSVNDGLPGGDDRRARAVDDVLDAAVALARQADRHPVAQFDAGDRGRFDGVLGHDPTMTETKIGHQLLSALNR
jgi:hypothetical protein